jgi:hypothetical protein
MPIKPAYLVTNEDYAPTYDKAGDFTDYASEKAALKAAKELLSNSEGQDAEVWVWRLAKVLSKPDMEPVIEDVK